VLYFCFALRVLNFSIFYYLISTRLYESCFVMEMVLLPML